MDYPKDLHENLRYRKAIREWAASNPQRQCEIMARCRDGAVGFLYWVNTFCWLFEPRPQKDATGRKMPSIIPFITWPHQDRAASDIFDVLGYEDLQIEKSRGEGASWEVLMAFDHQFIFEEMQSFGLVSRNEDAVDKPNDPDTLMWKIDWQHDRLPGWMRPKVSRLGRDHVIANITPIGPNKINGSTIIGYPAVADLTSGGRKTAMLMDEFAKFKRPYDEEAMSSTEPVTNCRILCSTPKGAVGAFYKATKEKNSGKRIRLHWTDNPTRNPGLYRVVDGEPVAIDPVNNPLPAGYLEEWRVRIKRELEDRGFDINKGVRSPWYDKRCLRQRVTPVSIAQEYDIDYIGSASKFFSGAMIDRLEKETARPDIIRGELYFDTEDFEPKWVVNSSGRLRLWFKLPDLRPRPPEEKAYVVGADVASGQGGSMSSNSVLSIVERETGIKVAEFAASTLSPEDFANYAIAICKFFHGDESDAYLIWEDNGYGGNFRNQIIRQGYRHFYLRTVEDEVSKRKSKKPGWRSSNQNKRSLLGDYAYALQTGKFTNPSYEALEEMRAYDVAPDGKIENAGESNPDDPSGGRHSHGDRVIADAVTWHACSEFRGRGISESLAKSSKKASPKTFAYRQQLRREQQREESYW